MFIFVYFYKECACYLLEKLFNIVITQMVLRGLFGQAKRTKDIFLTFITYRTILFDVFCLPSSNRTVDLLIGPPKYYMTSLKIGNTYK